MERGGGGRGGAVGMEWGGGGRVDQADGGRRGGRGMEVEQGRGGRGRGVEVQEGTVQFTSQSLRQPMREPDFRHSQSPERRAGSPYQTRDSNPTQSCKLSTVEPFTVCSHTIHICY